MSLKYTLQSLRWVKALWSPFKPFKIGFYAGKLAIGTPYFFPRKWVKFTEEDIQEAMAKHKVNKNYVQHIDSKLYDMYKNYTKAVPIKVGFDWCSLGWKTKWDEYDFRHEWNPVLSFVFFGYQIAMTVYHKHHSHYWESWLCYEYRSDKKKSKRKRIAFCRRKSPQTWSSGSGEDKVITDYWDLILKPKYQRKINEHK